MPRDRFATRAVILDAAALLIASLGLPQLGVNSLAHAAKCDKVLIYRYFGGLNGVLDALSAERMLWPRVEIAPTETEGNASLADTVQSLLLEEWAALSRGSLMRESASAELMNGGALGTAATRQRTELHAQLIASLRDRHRIPPYTDLAALVELLSAALTLFALRATHATPLTSGGPGTTPSPHQPFDPATPHGWRRIEKTLAAITRALLDADNG